MIYYAYYMKNSYLFIIIILGIFLFGSTALSQTPPQNITTPTLNTTIVPACQDPNSIDCYTLIEPLPGNNGVDVTSIDLATTGGTGGLGGFINFAMEIGIGVAGVLGVVMLVIYGFQYAAEDKNVGNFTILKDKITKVVLGLMLLLGITIILRTINPDLLIVEPDLKNIGLDVSVLASDQGASGSGTGTTPLSITNILNRNVTTYDAVLKDAAQAAGIDCGLLKAFMYVESSGGQSTLSRVGARGIIQIMPTTAYDTAPSSIRTKVAADFPGQTISYKWEASQQAAVHASLKRNGIDLDVPKTNATMAAQLIKGFIDRPGNSQGTGIVRYAAHAYNGGRGANANCTASRGTWLCDRGPAENKTYGPKVIRSYQNIMNNQWSCDPSSKDKGFRRLDI